MADPPVNAHECAMQGTLIDERLTRQTDARPGRALTPRPGADVRYATGSASSGFYLREFSLTGFCYASCLSRFC